MLKRTIKYEDFDGNEQEEVFYFNISKPELIEMEVEHPLGFTNWMEEVMRAKDNKVLMEQFKKIILMSYGEKSPDGRQFVKNDELRAKFENSAAYIALFTEFIMEKDALADFTIGILPRDMRGEIEAAATKVASEASAAPATTT